MRGERADRVPLVVPGCLVPSADSLEQIEDPLRRTIAERIARQMHFDVGVNSHVNRYLVTPPHRIRSESEALPNGRRRAHGVIDTPRGELNFLTEWNPESPQTTWTLKYPCETYDDIDKIASVPWELPEGLRPPQLDDLPADFAERGIVRTGVSSPFVCVAGMMRYERFLELCATDLPLLQELTDICRQRVLDCLRVLFAEPGIEYVWMGGSEWVTPPMASPRIYDALVQEQERDLIDFVHTHSDAVVHIHCHGHIRDALPKTIARGADYTEPCEPPPDGDITMAEAKALAAGRITLGGNIEARVLCYADEPTVEQAVRAAFEGGKERFVLAPTEGPSPRLSERECRNYLRLVDVWEELSPIA
jgi:hypothetical protein